MTYVPPKLFMVLAFLSMAVLLLAAAKLHGAILLQLGVPMDDATWFGPLVLFGAAVLSGVEGVRRFIDYTRNPL